ncbi:hypothetical protein ABW21_db0202150 [Orbilia brochopaga]|nr:hypothetical protein ABW21_db0202150 [Drechslerella brochopaga]
MTQEQRNILLKKRGEPGCYQSTELLAPVTGLCWMQDAIATIKILWDRDKELCTLAAAPVRPGTETRLATHNMKCFIDGIPMVDMRPVSSYCRDVAFAAVFVLMDCYFDNGFVGGWNYANGNGNFMVKMFGAYCSGR